MAWRTIRTCIVATVISLVSTGFLRAQTSHRARTCGQSACSDWDIQTATPSSADPLFASVINYVGGGGSTQCVWPSPMSIVNWGEVTVDQPFRVAGAFETLNCQGGGSQGATTIFADYIAQDVEFYFTRTDQPAAPGETVQVRLNTEWRGHTLATFDTATIDISYSIEEMSFAGSLPHSVFLLMAVGLQESPVSVGNGNWNTTPIFMPFRTVSLNTPLTFNVTGRIQARENVDNNHLGGITRYESVTSMGLRLASRPVSFSGPGTYTVHAPALNIHDNYWPVGAVIDENTTQPELDALTEVDGSIIIEGAPGIGCLSFGNLTQVTGSMIAQGAGVSCIHMPGAIVGGDVIVNDNEGDIIVEVGGTVGNIIVDNNHGDVSVDVDSSDGDIVITEPDGGVTIDAGSSGGIAVESPNGGVSIDAGSSSGDIVITEPDGGVTIDAGSSSGDIVITEPDNVVVVVVDTADGGIFVTDPGGAVVVDASGDVEGDITITNNPGGRSAFSWTPDDENGITARVGDSHPVTVTLNGSTVTGSVTLLGVGPTTLTMPGPLTIGGNLEADNIAQPSLDLSQVNVGGRTALASTGTNPILTTAAALDTDLHMSHGTDRLELLLPTGAAVPGAALSVQRVGGAELPWESGLAPDGSGGVLNPFSRYGVEVSGGTLAQPATLALALELTGLSPSDSQMITAAYAADRLTLARKSGGGPLTSLPLCEIAQPAEGCAALRLLDPFGQPTVPELAATAELSTLTTQFSDWAIVVVAAPGSVPAVGEWGVTITALLTLIAGTLLHMRRTPVRCAAS